MSSKTMSEATQQKVDAEIRSILDEQYALARRLLEENRDKVDVMAKALLEWETIDADQINDIMAGDEPRPPRNGVPAKKSSSDNNRSGDVAQRHGPGLKRAAQGARRECLKPQSR
jgi:cell division protease FtsH